MSYALRLIASGQSAAAAHRLSWFILGCCRLASYANTWSVRAADAESFVSSFSSSHLDIPIIRAPMAATARIPPRLPNGSNVQDEASRVTKTRLISQSPALFLPPVRAHRTIRFRNASVSVNA
ncbi:hypothetical protein B0T10DRAFT_460255 [Thelonectria olida]|uniref:Uncharacterized protein n=1 Tax=Thelonectria olida TaxID=1576542 RepID=A0A9P8W3U3_9HYPO|nr:hypothetical protein B0T10DRAFT_460255 [Thelonectria olida]